MIPFIYLLSFLFSDPSSAYARLSLILTLIGLGEIFAVLLTARPAIGLDSTSKVIKWIFYPLPQFAFVQASWILRKEEELSSGASTAKYKIYPGFPSRD